MLIQETRTKEGTGAGERDALSREVQSYNVEDKNSHKGVSAQCAAHSNPCPQPG